MEECASLAIRHTMRSLHFGRIKAKGKEKEKTEKEENLRAIVSGAANQDTALPSAMQRSTQPTDRGKETPQVGRELAKEPLATKARANAMVKVRMDWKVCCGQLERLAIRHRLPTQPIGRIG